MWIKEDLTNFLLRKLYNAFKKMNHENFANALNIYNMMSALKQMLKGLWWSKVFKSETNATDVIIGLVVYHPSHDRLISICWF